MELVLPVYMSILIIPSKIWATSVHTAKYGKYHSKNERNVPRSTSK